MDPTYVRTLRDGPITTLVLDRPEKRNALSIEVMRELTAAVADAGESDALGVILAANGSVFSAGHNFGDMRGASLAEARALFATCTAMLDTIQQIPQPVCAKVHALATAAGCQLVATCDLAVASEDAAFAIPGGKGGLFCHTPLVAVARNIGRKRALEMAMTGDPIDAHTAAEWGLVNRVVPADRLDEETLQLIRARDAWLGRVEGPRQARLLRPDRPRPAEGLRLRDGADGVGRGDIGGAGGDRSVPREAAGEVREWTVSAPANVRASASVSAPANVRASTSVTAPVGGELDGKLARLEAELLGLERVVVAFSGGADSAVPRRTSPSACSGVTPCPRGHGGVGLVGRRRGGRLPARWPASGACGGRRSATDEMARAAYRANDADRCYHCKTELMDVVGPIADAESGDRGARGQRRRPR